MNLAEFARLHPEVMAVARDCEDNPIAFSQVGPKGVYLQNSCCGDPFWWWAGAGIIESISEVPEDFPSPGNPRGSLTYLQPIRGNK